MFSFLSETIEESYFDSIEIFFLLVGHTHKILDQWFGVLAAAIESQLHRLFHRINDYTIFTRSLMKNRAGTFAQKRSND